MNGNDDRLIGPQELKRRHLLRKELRYLFAHETLPFGGGSRRSTRRRRAVKRISRRLQRNLQGNKNTELLEVRGLGRLQKLSPSDCSYGVVHGPLDSHHFLA